MKTASIGLLLFWLSTLLSGCSRFHFRPKGVPSSAVWVDGAFIDCSIDKMIKKNRCTVFDDHTGEILAEGLFALANPGAAGKSELQFAAYGDRKIFLQDTNILSLEEASERDPTNRLIDDRLKSLATRGGVTAANCGKTTTNKPEEQVSACAKTAFESRKPFYVTYSFPGKVAYISYGLAQDAEGNVFEVLYNIRGVVKIELGRNDQIYDKNHIRVTPCVRPVTLGKTEEGMLACIPPINERESALAAQQKPIETTVCAIAENPAAFNNKLVRVRGHVSGNFEYSMLDGDGCSGSLWFAYGGDSAPPGLEAYVSGGAVPGAVDPDGKVILPIPVKLVQDSAFRRFQSLMTARVKADALYEKKNPGKFLFHRMTATFVGRIDGVSDEIHKYHQKKSEMDKADYLGFGQMGLFDAQLVVQSVENDAVLSVEPQQSTSQ